MADLEYKDGMLCAEKISISDTETYQIENDEWVRLTIDSSNKIIDGIRRNGITYISELDNPNISDINENINILNEQVKIINPFIDKKIIWFGTSIPAQGYPSNVGNILGCTVINNAVGSSMVRFGRHDRISMKDGSVDPLGDDLGITGISFTNFCLALSVTQEEKRKVFDLWTDEARKNYLISQGYTSEQVANVKGYGTLLGGSFGPEETDPSSPGRMPSYKPVDVWAFEGEKYKDMRQFSYRCSWNNSLDIEQDLDIEGAIHTPINGLIEPYLTGNNVPDLWVFEHAHNDQIQDFDLDVDIKTTDRSYFIGAMNYLFDKILYYNPRARIVIIGNYSDQAGMNGLDGTPRVTEIQEKIAHAWQFQICKFWENIQFCPMPITTNGYWDINKVWHDSGFDGTNHHQSSSSSLACPENPRQLLDGTWVHDLTLGQVWMQDVLHPSSTETKIYCAKILASWFKANIIL